MSSVLDEMSSLKGLLVGVERSLRKSRQGASAVQRRDLVRGLTVLFVRSTMGSKAPGVRDVAAKLYPDDNGLQRSFTEAGIFHRSAVAPAQTTVSGWASELVDTETVSNLLALSPQSLASRLARRGLQLTSSSDKMFRLPHANPTSPAIDVFQLEAAAIPVRNALLSAADFKPKRAALISTFTNELARQSTPSIEAVIERVVGMDLSRGLDKALISPNARSAQQPAGLLAGAAEITESTSTDPAIASAEDIASLIEAITVPGGPIDPVLVVPPKQAASLSLLHPGSALPVFSCDLLPAGLVLAFDAAFFVLVGSPDVFSAEISSEALLHENTAPNDNIMAGSPVRSLWQTDAAALRLLEWIDWQQLSPVAFATDVQW